MGLAAGDRADGTAREAFGEFFRRHEPWLQAMVRTRKLGRLVDWEEGVKDVVQITFQRAFENAGAFDLERLGSADATKAVRAWLGGIANYVVVDLFRAQVRADELDEATACADPAPAADEDPEKPSALVQAMAAELEALYERERDIMLADMEHKTGAANEHLPAGVAKALAERWNTTPENIRQIRRRTRQLLKAKLEHLLD